MNGKPARVKKVGAVPKPPCARQQKVYCCRKWKRVEKWLCWHTGCLGIGFTCQWLWESCFCLDDMPADPREIKLNLFLCPRHARVRHMQRMNCWQYSVQTIVFIIEMNLQLQNLNFNQAWWWINIQIKLCATQRFQLYATDNQCSFYIALVLSFLFCLTHLGSSLIGKIKSRPTQDKIKLLPRLPALLFGMEVSMDLWTSAGVEKGLYWQEKNVSIVVCVQSARKNLRIVT